MPADDESENVEKVLKLGKRSRVILIEGESEQLDLLRDTHEVYLIPLKATSDEQQLFDTNSLFWSAYASDPCSGELLVMWCNDTGSDLLHHQVRRPKCPSGFLPPCFFVGPVLDVGNSLKSYNSSVRVFVMDGWGPRSYDE